LEQEHQIVTQDLKMSNALEIVKRGKPETLRNIVAKSNEKLGGLNYTLRLKNENIQSLIDDGTLFIGLGISHPGAMGNLERARGATPTQPSVIGYAANILKDPFDIIGDYLFDEPRRDEKFSTMSTIVETCVKRWRKHHDNPPKRLILFRNGSSDGQFASILEHEIPLVHYALKQANAVDCKITVMVSQRSHNIRLFPENIDESTQKNMSISAKYGRSGAKLNLNIKPGTVVDSMITHPEQPEFYLNAHLAIQGTTRTPRYTILLDESDFSSDEIQSMTYALAYGHQIINSPTSLPAPAYIALMYAKRGRAVFTIKQNEMNYRRDDGGLDYPKISETLNYGNTEIGDRRINA